MAKKKEPKKPAQQKKPEQKKFDHPAKADQVRSVYKASIEGVVKAGVILQEYQDFLADIREFSRFWKDHLGWAKTTVYRLVDVGRHFGHLPGKTLVCFDLSALYLLATKKVKAGVRNKAIKKAAKGEFVAHADVRGWIGKKPANPAKPTDPPITARPGTIRIDLERLTAEAKKLKLNAGKVVELLERLGVGVDWQGEKPVEATKATKQPKKEVA